MIVSASAGCGLRGRRGGAIVPKARRRKLREFGAARILPARSARSAMGDKDRIVLARAMDEGAVMLTFDKDFGELARGVPATPGFGVVLFRVPPPRTSEAGGALAEIIRSREGWEGRFSVVEPGRLRMRALKPP